MPDLALRDQREPGWFYVDNEIIDRYGARLGAYGVALYAALCRHSRNATQTVQLSQRDMASALAISQDRVRKSLRDLIDLDLVHVEVPEHPSPGTISTILLLRVKTTERHTFSSAVELNATRSRNKEVKTKTETKNPSPLSGEFDFALEENARARESTRSAKKDYDPEVGDAIDRRKLTKAFEEITRQREARVGSGSSLTGKEVFEWACELAGISVQRALEVQDRGKQWPATQALEASA